MLADWLRTVTLLAVALAFACAGCGGDDDDGGGGGSSGDGGGGNGGAGNGGGGDGGGRGSAFEAFVDDTEGQLEGWWADAMLSFSDGTFTAPDVQVYREDATPAGSACIEQADPVWADNSFYCPPDETLYLDADYLPELGAEFDTPETAAVMVHAHEFGHHVQHLDHANPKLKIGNELQADCYAGVFLSAVDDGDVVLDANVNAAEALLTMRSLADTDWEYTRWFDPQAHGGPLERAQAMATGFITKDPQFCQGYETTDPIEPLTVGPYSFRPAPASDIEEEDYGYSMRVESQAEIFMEISPWTSLPASATAALGQVAPKHFEGTDYQYIDEPNSFDAPVADFSVANLRYDQVLEGEAYHGVLVLVTRGDGTALLMDSYAPGAAPAADDDASWEVMGDYAFAALWGMSE